MTLLESTSSDLVALADLTRTLGEPDRDLVILGEGNTSIACSDGTFWIKASGVRMERAACDDFVRLTPEPLIDLLSGPELSEDALKEATAAACVEGDARPSIEAILHALCTAEFGAVSAAHTHPVSVNGILSSSRSTEMAGGVLFPDQAVVLGAETVFVEYAEPGIRLAKAVQAAVREHLDSVGERPRAVWLENHGMLALGDSPSEVLAITEMADKFARVLAGALAVGEPRWLGADTVRSLVGRDDEIERRVMLAQAGSAS